MIIDKLLTAEAVGKQLAQKQSDARSPSTSTHGMIDLTMDDEEKADGDAHTASDNKHQTVEQRHIISTWHGHED